MRGEEEERNWCIVRRGIKLCQDLALIAGQPNTIHLVYIMGEICLKEKPSLLTIANNHSAAFISLSALSKL